VSVVEIRATPEAVAFIQDNGGRLFVWIDAASLKHVTLHPPEQEVDFKQIPCDGFEFNVHVEIAEAVWWKVVLHRFPRHYVGALWNGSMPPETHIELAGGPVLGQ
jgi:hypothetical protein